MSTSCPVSLLGLQLTMSNPEPVDLSLVIGCESRAPRRKRSVWSEDVEMGAGGQAGEGAAGTCQDLEEMVSGGKGHAEGGHGLGLGETILSLNHGSALTARHGTTSF